MSAATTTFAGDSAVPSQSVVVVTLTSSQDTSGQTTAPVVVTEYSTVQYTPSTTRAATSSTRSGAATATSAPATSGNSTGLGTGGTIAIAVAVPVVVLALLAILGFWFWKKRKSNKTALAQRKEEQDQYAFHPNEPAFNSQATQYGAPIAGAAALGAAGTYRGWQPTNVTRQTTATSNSGFQNGRLGSAATTAPYFERERSRSGNLETPTLPAIGHMDDLDSILDSPGYHTRGVLSPGNGSPPLDAIATGSPSSEYSQKDLSTGREHRVDAYQHISPTSVPSSTNIGTNQASREKYSRTYFDD